MAGRLTREESSMKAGGKQEAAAPKENIRADLPDSIPNG
jgi:hypothetical protein